MKKIKIENYSPKDVLSIYKRDKSYRISLGNETTRSFTNKKDLTKFLVETNNFLNTKIFEINSLFAQVFVEYRKIWFYFDNKMFEHEGRKIENSFEWVARVMNLSIDRANWRDGNHFTFQHLKNGVKNLKVILKILVELQRSKSNYVEKYNLEVIASRLDSILISLKSYGKIDGEKTNEFQKDFKGF